MKITKIYPKYQVHEDYAGHAVIASTLVRKKHQGKWYLTAVICNSRMRDWSVETERRMAKEDAIAGLHEQCYFYLTTGKVNPDMKGFYGENLFLLDTDQRDEEERLKYRYGVGLDLSEIFPQTDKS